jgi:hypothetical protein
MSSFPIAGAVGLGAGVLHAVAFLRMTVGLLVAWSSPLMFVSAAVCLRLLWLLAGVLMLSLWGPGAACAGLVGYWIGLMAVVTFAASERSR